MQTVLIAIHLMVVVALVIVVLLQRSEGGALGVGGGGFFTGRGQTTALTRATAILAAIFFATSMGLSILAGWGKGEKSLLDIDPPPPISGQAPASKSMPGGSLSDELRKLQDERAPAGAPPGGAPSAPQSQ